MVHQLAESLGRGEAETFSERLDDAETKAVVEMFSRLTLGVKLVDVQVKKVVDTLTDILAKVEAETLSDTMGYVEKEALVDIPVKNGRNNKKRHTWREIERNGGQGTGRKVWPSDQAFLEI